MGITKSGVRMELALTTETPDGVQTTQTHSLVLNVAEQRAIVERDSGEPCFRMWLSADEHNKIRDMLDWTCYRLSDGRWAVWRKESDLALLKQNGAITVAQHIEGRRLADEVE
jgi:hypothetical protein